MVSNLNDLKKRIFFDMLSLAGRVFIVVRYAETVVIGNRGFTPDEKEQGLVLVFNRIMQFDWDDTGIHASLGFGSKVEKCFIPPDEIIAVFSPELTAQFVTSSGTNEGQNVTDVADVPAKAPSSSVVQPGKIPDRPPPGDKVVKVDFSKKK